MNDFLDQLNQYQREAVCYNDGPSLVIAGAGSGKTRVLTYKIAYLLQSGYKPQNILALTFTNKAAREMKNRIATVVGNDVTVRLWMGTFHSIFSRILRANAELIGYTSQFTIYDSADSRSLIKMIIKEMQLDDKIYKPASVQACISNAKNALITPAAYAANKEIREADERGKKPLLYEIYRKYWSRCFLSGAMDFDDLLLYTNILFRDHPEVTERYRELFQYILVDEYQDTNFAQHLIVQQIAKGHKRICVVGDDAQSIYSFRGANISNILNLQKEYPGCKIFKLEQNYRSTQNIVNAANSLIDKNTERIKKNVFSENNKGNKIDVLKAYSDFEEGYIIANKISEMRLSKGYKFSDFAILYRTNAQSRIFEEALRKRNIPYKIYGGLSFYQRKEIKDVIAYFRLTVNAHDEEAFKRVINYPARGIGDTTIGKIAQVAIDKNVSLWDVICDPVSYALPVNSGTANKLKIFKDLIESFHTQLSEKNVFQLAEGIVKQSGIVHDLYADNSPENVSRQENLQELLNGIRDFCEQRQEEGNEQIGLSDFLSEISLASDQDENNDDDNEKITLMTVHASKGLEFRNVFVVGLEEDLFPSVMSKSSPREIEEERRLLYVAITRAEENCTLSYATSRYRNGQSTAMPPSRFLKDIDPSFLQLPEGENRDYEDRNREAKARTFSPRTTTQPQTSSYGKRPENSPTLEFTEKPRKLTKIEVNTTSNASQSAAPQQSTVRVGNTISHERFGEGEVTDLQDYQGDIRITVQFRNTGTKQLLLKFARFTIIK